MLRRLGRRDQALECYRRALPFAPNEQVRRFIGQRLREAMRKQLLLQRCP
jgi:predicted RNA polymerase sigma factor